MLWVDFIAGLPAPLDCGLRGVAEAGFAFEAILVVEAIAKLPVKIFTVPPSHKKFDGGSVGWMSV